MISLCSWGLSFCTPWGPFSLTWSSILWKRNTVRTYAGHSGTTHICHFLFFSGQCQERHSYLCHGHYFHGRQREQTKSVPWWSLSGNRCMPWIWALDGKALVWHLLKKYYRLIMLLSNVIMLVCPNAWASVAQCRKWRVACEALGWGNSMPAYKMLGEAGEWAAASPGHQRWMDLHLGPGTCLSLKHHTLTYICCGQQWTIHHHFNCIDIALLSILCSLHTMVQLVGHIQLGAIAQPP